MPSEVVKQALAQKRARRAAEREISGRLRDGLPDELIDERLAGRSGEAKIVGADGCWRADPSGWSTAPAGPSS